MDYNSPELYFFEDDGKIPNSQLPLVLYRHVTYREGAAAARFFEKTFKDHGWSNSWKDEVYDFDHFHSTAYEVLGVFQGSALLQLGGVEGERIEVAAGDVILIPPGVGHKCLLKRDDFEVVGAYAEGRDWDLKVGTEDQREEAFQNFAHIPIPPKDPVYGKPLRQIISSLQI